MTGDRDAAARRFLATTSPEPARPASKIDYMDRRAIRSLWSLLYRALRRQSVRLDQSLRSIASLARRVGNLSTEVTNLRFRVEQLEAAERRRRTGA